MSIRLHSVVAFIVFGASAVAAQEFGVHGATALPRYPDQRAANGFGVSLAGSFRIGSILADTSLARRASVRLGARVSLTELRSREQWTPPCEDFCPLALYAPTSVDVELRIVDGSLFVVPYRRASTQVELDAGVASYTYRRNVETSDRRQGTWGFTAGARVARRLGASPVWLAADYARRAVSPIPPPQDASSVTPPPHSFRLGVVYRVADR